jgi:hypothetical protein
LRLALLAFCAVAFLAQSAIAQSPQWQVQPSICVSQQLGENCEFEVDITILNLPAGQYCLALAGAVLRCASAADFPLRISIRINKNSELSLLNSTQQRVLGLTLLVKSRQASKQKRRLRNPWSLF